MQQRQYSSSYSAFDLPEGGEAPGGNGSQFVARGGYYSNNFAAPRSPGNVGREHGAIRGIQLSQGATGRYNYRTPPSSQFHNPSSFLRGSSVASTNPEFERFPTPTSTQQSIPSTQTQQSQSNREPSVASQTGSKKTGGGRGSNFTKVQLEQLCRSWLNSSEDAIAGTNQQQSTFWQAITYDFNSRLPPESHRTLKSLESRWSTLNHAMAKFAGCVQQIEMLRETGKGPHDQFVDTLKMYKADIGSQFKFVTAYDVVKNSPKWKMNSVVMEHCQSGVNQDFVIPHHAHLTPDTPPSSSATNTDIEALPTLDQPNGNKKAKRKRGAKAEPDLPPEFTSNQSSQLRITERIAEQGERATAALERIVELSVLSMDTSRLDERTRMGIQAAKDAINDKDEAQRDLAQRGL